MGTYMYVCLSVSVFICPVQHYINWHYQHVLLSQTPCWVRSHLYGYLSYLCVSVTVLVYLVQHRSTHTIITLSPSLAFIDTLSRYLIKHPHPPSPSPYLSVCVLDTIPLIRRRASVCGTKASGSANASAGTVEQGQGQRLAQGSIVLPEATLVDSSSSSGFSGSSSSGSGRVGGLPTATATEVSASEFAFHNVPMATAAALLVEESMTMAGGTGGTGGAMGGVGMAEAVVIGDTEGAGAGGEGITTGAGGGGVISSNGDGSSSGSSIGDRSSVVMPTKTTGSSR